jgi:hypothetical protein
MSRGPQYTFALDALGKPTRETHHSERILERLVRHSLAQQEDAGDLSSFVELARWKQLLPGMFRVQVSPAEELNAHDTATVVMDGITQCALKAREGKREPFRDVLRRCDTAVRRLLACGRKRYSVVTHLSLPCSEDSIVSCNRFTLRPYKAVLEKWTPLALHEASRWEHLDEWRACKFSLFQVDVESFSEHQATHLALKALGVVRALGSLREPRHSVSVQLTGHREYCLAPVHVGPVQIVMNADGREHTETVWYQPSYSRENDSSVMKKPSEQVWQALREDLKSLDSRPYREELEALLLLYISSLDERHWPACLLGLWNVLEKVTNSRQKSIAKRATRFAINPPYERELVKIAKCTRNRFVHTGYSDALNEQWAYVIRPLVEDHLSRLLNTSCGVASLSEYAYSLAKGAVPSCEIQ